MWRVPRRASIGSTCVALALLLSFGSGRIRAGEVPLPATPQQQFGALYDAVEQAHIFPDSKTFADAVPLGAPDAILAAFQREQPASEEALKAFVQQHFTLPQEPAAAEPSSTIAPISSHIDELWGQLTRTTLSVPAGSSLLPLPEAYVVPGGRFRELYYWDSYFTMLGLKESARQDLLEDMVRDFASLIDTYGHVPNGTRSYYLSRSQPPFFFAMVALLSPKHPATAWARFLPELEREHEFWMRGAEGLKSGMAAERVVGMSDGSILNRYWDELDTPRDESYAEDMALAKASRRPSAQLYRDLRAAAESGWDFSSRWLADGHTLGSIETSAIVPVDLNSLLYGLERAIAAACERQHQEACTQEYAQQARRRRASIDRYLWDAERGTYVDYQWQTGARSPRLSAAMFYPLFVQLGTRAQARRVSSTALDLWAPGGLATTTRMTGQQWDAPNGWAPLQWIAISGLRRYGYNEAARTLACRFMVTVNALYAQSGRLIEKYDVLHPGRSGGGGEYPLQDGFGWTNGIMRELMDLYPREAEHSEPDECP